AQRVQGAAMAVVAPTVRRPAVRRPARRPTTKHRTSRKPALPDANVVSGIRELAGTGQHAAAIEQCTQALAAQDGMRVGVQMDLLDLRAESLVAMGEMAHAARDADAMVELATRETSAALKAKALNRKAVVNMRQGNLTRALEIAIAGAKAARQA